MNNDLENLYGNNSNSNSDKKNNDNNITSNNIFSTDQNLSSLYNHDALSNNSINESSDIKINKEGLAKMYNQQDIDLEAETKQQNKGPTIIKEQLPDKKTIPNNEYVTEEDLLVAYVGKNFEKIASNPINFSALFFGSAYLFYRKKIIYGLLLSVISTILSCFLHSLLVSVGLSIIVGLLFNRIYINDAKKNIEKIKKRNSTNTNVELRELCKKRGGKSILFIIIGSMILFPVNILTNNIMLSLGFSPNVSEIDINKFEIFNNNKNIYLGSVEKDKSIDIENKIIVTIPDEFQNTSEANYEISYTNNNCSFKIYKAYDIKDAKKLIKEMSIYYLSYEDVSTTKIDNIEWNWIKNKDGNDIEYHYVTSNKNELYIFEYISDNKDITCLNNKDKILNSIKYR